jgi:antitoxin Phd
MKRVWQIQEAKNKLSEVIEEAVQHGPQIITRRGVEVVVVLSYEEYAKDQRSRAQSGVKLSDFFHKSPLAGMDLKRDRSLPRDDMAL